MGFDPQDQDVIRQLSKLKQADTEYPPELLAARRHLFLKRMGEMSLGIGAASNVPTAPKIAKAPPTTPIASTLLETVLVVAIIAEAGAVAYFYRDKLSDMVKTFVASAEVQEIISPPVFTTSTSALTTAIDTPSPEHTSTPELEHSPTPQLLMASEAPAGVVVTSTGTPVPGIVDDINPVNATAAVEINSTPNLNGNNGNNGNHYGQTPKPERTKENNGNDNKPPKEDEKPPKEEPPKDDDKPPKDDPKPTKSK